MRWLDDITDSKDMNLVKLWEMMKGQESLVCSSPWGPKELDMTWQLNNKNKNTCMFLTLSFPGHFIECPIENGLISV